MVQRLNKTWIYIICGMDRLKVLTAVAQSLLAGNPCAVARGELVSSFYVAHESSVVIRARSL